MTATATEAKKTASTKGAAKKIAKSAGKSPVRAVLGVDIGGSGIKGAPVNVSTGELLAERLRIPTPQPSRPEAVAEVVREIAEHFAPITGDGPFGCTFPGVVRDGVTHSAANVDSGWLQLDADALFEKVTGRRVTVLNDAQAAALAEATCGVGKGNNGLLLMLTFGTGIGSGLVFRGVALPGIEFGHLRLDGKDAERTASANAREENKQSWKAWSREVQTYLSNLEAIVFPDLIIVGGGVSEKAEKWVPRLKTRTPVVVAALTNEAGIVGAALAAHQLS
jgi:polyphosphate glucokinase